MNSTLSSPEALAIAGTCLVAVYSLDHKLWTTLNTSYPVLAPARFVCTRVARIPPQASSTEIF